MIKYFLVLCFLFSSCATVVEQEVSHIVGQRWIDMNDILSFVKYSESSDMIIKYSDVLHHLGEPIYLEKYNIENDSNMLLWYLYKSKHYPVLEKDKRQNLQFNPLRNRTVGSQGMLAPEYQELVDSKQIKPDMIADYQLWGDSEKWIVIVVNDKYHEIIFTEMKDFKSLSKGMNKEFIKDLDPKSAKILLENN